ncbi:MAG: THUMP domain-containing class I SAM-dependent RNA methyltransferase [Myxococcales bacterium]
MAVPLPLDHELLFLSTTPGLEKALEAEASALGEARLVPGGVELRGRAGLHRRANLWLRTASRVLLRLGELPAADPRALEAALAALPLDRVRLPGAPLRLEASVRDGRISERELAAIARRAFAAPDGGEVALRLRVERGRCTLSADTSGELLYRRGWRQEVSRAPLRETLAAGLLLLAGYDGSEPLWDPLCGSGTLALEAASLALGRAPGFTRRFAFEGWPGHDAAAWQREREAALGRPKSPQPIWGSDLNAGSLGTARRNARRAGLEGAVALFRHDARLPRPELPARGLLVANLPYGKRAGSREDVPELYRQLGRAFRALAGWRAAFLVEASSRAEQWLGLAVERAIELDNGGIPCRLLLGRFRLWARGRSP